MLSPNGWCWCWFVLREKYCWQVVSCGFFLREKYCWLVSDKQAKAATQNDGDARRGFGTRKRQR
jgi:hypothetical protein